jgi:amino acid transporter
MLGLELTSVTLIIILAVITIFNHPLDTIQLKLADVSTEQIKLGLVLAIFSFVGFESATSLGEEAKSPLKNIPLAVVVSALFVGSIFILTSYAEVLGFRGYTETLDKSSAPLNHLAETGGVSFLIPLISLGAVISFFACTLACINAGARILFHMSRHGLFHKSLGNAHSENETPHGAVLIASILTFLPAAILAGVGVGPFDIYGWVGTVATLGFIITYITISVAAPVYLKKKGKLTAKGIIIPGISIVLLLIAIIGNIYPVPPAPYNYLPYILLGYLIVGVVWFAIAKKKNPEIGEIIKSDIKEIEDRWKSVDSASL